MENIKQLTTEEYRLLQSNQDRTRWTEVYKLPADMYWPVQAPLSSKRKGDIWETLYKAKCLGLEDRTDRWHDATVNDLILTTQQLRGKRVEIKYTTIAKPDSAKAIDKRGWTLEAGERTKLLKSNAKAVGGADFISGGTFQQIHPDNADYGLFSAVFGNGAVHYWVPYHLISKTAGAKNAEPGKIPLQSMHHGATVEGQIGRPEKFHNLFLLDITWNTPFITDLNKYDLTKYENIKY